MQIERYCGTVSKTAPFLRGDPTDVSTGNQSIEETDISGSILTFRRHYNSDPSKAGGGTFGLWWRGDFDRSVVMVDSSDAAVYRPDGTILYFTLLSGVWTPDADVNDHLVEMTDSGGNVLGWTVFVAADNSQETYDATGTLTAIQLLGGRLLQLSYSTSSTPSSIAPGPGLLLQVSDQFGHALNFVYDGNSEVVTLTDAAGNTYQYGYDGAGTLTGVTYPDGTTRSYFYNEPDHTGGASLPNALTGIADEAQVRFADYTYDPNTGRALSSQRAGGVLNYAFSYGTDANGNDLTTETDPLGTQRSFDFNKVLGLDHLGTGTEPQASGSGLASDSRVYDANGNVKSETDFNGNTTTYDYDLTRNLEKSRTEATGTARARTIQTQWNSDFRLPALITEPNRATTFTYDSFGNVKTATITDTTVTPNVSRTWIYNYDSLGRLHTAQGPRTDVNDTTIYAYYPCTTGSQCGQLQTITDALGHVTTFNTYNANAQPLTMTDANGVVTTLTYDLRGRLTSQSAGGETLSFFYYPTGLLQTVTLPDGATLQYTYDTAHRLTKINDGLGNNVVYTLDAMGNRKTENVFDPSGALQRTHSRAINALNAISQEINAAGTAAVTTTFGYDNNGNQTSIAAPLARNTGNAYDELNRLKQITDPASGITQFGYDANDNLTSVTDPRNLITSYVYNGFGDLVTQLSPDTATTTNTYDSGGNLATSTDARGAMATYTYDALNRVSSVAYALGGTTDQTISFTYDTGTNGIGHLTGASDANHSLGWSYDALGRVRNKSQTINGVTHSVGYLYTNGDLTTLTTPSGQTVAYGYNTNHQVTSLSVNGTTVLNNVTYEPLGPVNGWSWGNGTATTRSYDTDGKITQIASNGTKTYTYDDAFRISGITDTSAGSANWMYGYDALDRITSGNSASVTRGWKYDANGNRLTETGSSPSTYTISPTSNQITGITGSLARSYGYDAAGNTTSYASATDTYNNAGRLKTLTLGGSTETLIYNALGQRIQKSGGTAGTVLYWYDEAGHLLGEYDGSGNLIQETVWLGDIPVATLRPNGSSISIYYVHSDQLNTPRQVTRPSDNAQMWTWFSDPFGTDAANANPAGAGTFTYNLRLPGQIFDGQAGLHTNGYRDFDPATGRYVESDPIGLRGEINTYTYALSRPTTLEDPLGLEVVKSATSDDLTLLIPLLSQLESKINDSLNCCNKDGKQEILSRFASWVIERSADAMPSDPKEDTLMTTAGRANHTTYYSNTPISFGVLAHEWAHTLPQNVHSVESPSGAMFLPWAQQPWEKEAEQIAQRLSNNQNICDLLTGQAMPPDPALEMYAPRPGLGELIWNSLKSIFH